MLRSDGCHIRLLDMIKFLDDAGFRVIFYSNPSQAHWTWTPKYISEFQKQFPRINLIIEPTNFLSRAMRLIKNIVASYLPFLTRSVVRIGIPFITPAWSHLKSAESSAIFIVNYADGITQLNGVDTERTCVDTHDLGFRSYALNSGQRIWSHRVRRRLTKELSLLDCVRLTLTISPVERIFLKQALADRTILYVPPALTLSPRKKEFQDSSESLIADLLFLGSGNHKNTYYINDFLSKFVNWDANLTIAIAGDVSRKLSPLYLSHSHIKVLGYVDDIDMLYSQVRAAVCPVEGTGVNIKILEALAYGKPVFAAPAAIEALSPNSSECVFSLSQESVKHVLDNDDLYLVAGNAAKFFGTQPAVSNAWNDLRQQLEYLSR